MSSQRALRQSRFLGCGLLLLLVSGGVIIVQVCQHLDVVERESRLTTVRGLAWLSQERLSLCTNYNQIYSVETSTWDLDLVDKSSLRTSLVHGRNAGIVIRSDYDKSVVYVTMDGEESEFTIGDDVRDGAWSESLVYLVGKDLVYSYRPGHSDSLRTAVKAALVNDIATDRSGQLVACAKGRYVGGYPSGSGVDIYRDGNRLGPHSGPYFNVYDMCR